MVPVVHWPGTSTPFSMVGWPSRFVLILNSPPPGRCVPLTTGVPPPGSSISGPTVENGEMAVTRVGSAVGPEPPPPAPPPLPPPGGNGPRAVGAGDGAPPGTTAGPALPSPTV